MKKKLKFYEKSHLYKIGNTRLTSVTTFVSKFFSKFNARIIARKLAKFPVNKKQKHGVRWFLKDWKERAQFGTNVHKLVEWKILDEEPEDSYSLFTELEMDYARQGELAYHKIMRSLGEPVSYTELKVYNEELLLAGTIDLMVSHNHPDDTNNERVISLYDWKTNKKLNKKGYNNKKGILPPLLEVDDCHITKYGLQLSTYAYILERQGYKIDQLYIVHLKDDKYELIEVGYDRELIKKMIKEQEE